MKRISLLVLTAMTFTCAISSCGPKCKKCHAEAMGVKGPAQEMCGDQLKQAEKTPNIVCE